MLDQTRLEAIRNYIAQYRNQYPIESLQQQLLNSGYTQEEINATMQYPEVAYQQPVHNNNPIRKLNPKLISISIGAIIALVIGSYFGYLAINSNKSSSNKKSSSNSQLNTTCPSGNWTDNSIKIKSIKDLDICLKDFDEAYLSSTDGFEDSLFTFSFFRPVKTGSWDDVYKVYYDSEELISTIEFDIDNTNDRGYFFYSSSAERSADDPTMETLKLETDKKIEETISQLKEAINDDNKLTGSIKQSYLKNTDDIKIISLVKEGGDDYDKFTTAYYEIFAPIHTNNSNSDMQALNNYLFHLSIHIDKIDNDYFKTERKNVNEMALKIANSLRKRSAVIDKL